MFGRLLWQLLRGNRGRLAIALVAIAGGGAVISALFNMEIDVRKKLTQEFRSLGANVVVSGHGTGDQALMSESAAEEAVDRLEPQGAIASPYLYVVARTSANQPVVLAGTWLDRSSAMTPWWQIQGRAIATRTDVSHCLVGKNVARQFALAPGSDLELHYADKAAHFSVSGVITAGDDEDDQVFANLAAVQNLAGLADRIAMIQLRIPGSPESIQSVASQLKSALPDGEARPIRQISEAEGSLLARIQLLVITMALLILTLTGLCVLATMAALAMERRADVGLMKALGGSIGRVVGLFLAEVGVLGAVGGVLGYTLGAVLTLWIGKRVFGTAISPRLEVLPLTIALMVGVALAGALPLRLLGKVKPAVILRGE
ncbi:MAG: ABC transporter permease [Candidatus Acidiferrales bacterium]|jgi:putative ABC transport system permease protein